MAEASLKLGGSWATKEDSLLGFNDENDNYKPIPFDFSRASIGTRVNRDGLIETVQDNIPRIDFLDNADGALKLEPQRTNINTYSDPTDAQKGSTSYASVTYQDDFSWGLGNVINNAIVFEDNSTTRYAYYSSSVTSGTQYTLSVFVKMDDNSTPNPATDFLMVLAGVSFASGYNIEDYGNNIYRVSVSGTASASNTANGVLKIASHSSKGFKVSGFQLEAGSYPTSYIPTSGSAVTRVADSCSKTGASDLIGQTEGVIFIDLSDSNYQSGGADLWVAQISVNDSNVACLIYYSANTIFTYINNGTNSIILSASFTLEQQNKIAIGYKNGDYAIALNGVIVDTDSSAIVPPSGMNQFSFVKWQGSANSQMQSVKQASLYKTRLTNTELAELTTL